ncbi:MAG: hypothetical protein IJL06_00700, partial [Kiritimatiellae bacterium]|nr:hypothetical protein [Kiritimatiellia bacterium]
AREKAQLARKEAQRQPMRDVCDLALATFVGRMEPIFRRARAAGGWKEDLADRVMGSILRFEHAGTAHEAEILRVRSELLPIVEGLEGGQGALDEFLMLRRIASETLGKERERGRVNLANPSGVTPGSAREVEWGRSAQARLQWIRENQPEQWEKLNRAADTLVDIRRGRGRSVLAELRDSGLIREDAMKEIWNNTDYAAFRRQLGMGDALPPVNGKRAAGDMSTWSGVYKQVTGSYGDIESPLLATLVGDATILRLARLNAARRDTAALLRRFFPGEVREVDEARWHANSHGEKIPEQSKDARWRTLVWKENGETRALEVPRLVADALADERKDWGAGRWAVDALNAAGRAWSMAMTGMNYAFAVKNVVRDKAAIARGMPGRDWGDGAGARLSNVVGDYFTAAKTFASGHGQARRLGRANAELLHGLEEGVVAPGTMGGYMASLRGEDLAALYGPDTPARQRAIRGILEKSGLAPCVEKERTVVGKLAGKLWKLYASGIEKLADQETNNKVQAMLEIRRLHPEWSENRIAFHVARYIGTPDPTDAPNITKVPGFNLLVPFWTMTAHGNFDQIYRLGVEQKGASLARYGTHFAAKVLMNFSGKAVAAWGAAQLARAAA